MPQSKSTSVDSVQQARSKARQRLIGAVVLLLVGIIGFPLVFETQPRPIPVDVTIEIPRKDAAPVVQAPAPRPAATASAGAGAAAQASSGVVRRDEPVAAVNPASVARPAPVAAPAAPSVAAPASAPVIVKPPVPAPTSETPGRFVVQIGAFADATAVQAMRARAEKLGLKTYTQVAETVAGNRVRVRIGPFATREAAEKAAAKAKAGGLSAVVLTL